MINVACTAVGLCVQEVAQQLLPLVAPALLAAGGRYALVGHSMGCWAAYELLLLLRQEGGPMCCCCCCCCTKLADLLSAHVHLSSAT
jgi:surfactin synthase thioesterase subunit